MEEHSERALTDLVPQEWFAGDQYSGVQCAFFLTSLCRNAQPNEISQAVNALIHLDEAYQLTFLRDVTGLIIPTCSARVAYSDGVRQIHTLFDRISIPDGDYTFLATPMGLDPTSENLARERIRAIRGALVAMFGHTAAEDVAANFVLNGDGTTSIVSPIFETFLDATSFDFVPTEWVRRLTERRPFLPSDVGDRLNLALGFIARSAGVVDPIVRFSNTWIALEIAASGKPDKLIKAITPDGRKSGLLRELDLARNDLFHRGITPRMSPDAERALILAVLSDSLLRVGVEVQALRDVLTQIEASHNAG